MSSEKVDTPQEWENRERMNSDATKLGENDKEKELETARSRLARVETFPKEIEKRVRRKLDWNIVPLVTALYMLSVLDRSNVGNARIAGMSTDLNLYGDRYDWLLTIFYIPCNVTKSNRNTNYQIFYLNGLRFCGKYSHLINMLQQSYFSGDLPQPCKLQQQHGQD